MKKLALTFLIIVFSTCAYATSFKSTFFPASGGSTGTTNNQTLNTHDRVTFKSVTTKLINATNASGTVVSGNWNATIITYRFGGTNATSLAQAKNRFGISNVTNKNIHQWPGSANITTVGTISHGTWNSTINRNESITIPIGAFTAFGNGPTISTARTSNTTYHGAYDYARFLNSTETTMQIDYTLGNTYSRGPIYARIGWGVTNNSALPGQKVNWKLCSRSMEPIGISWINTNSTYASSCVNQNDTLKKKGGNFTFYTPFFQFTPAGTFGHWNKISIILARNVTLYNTLGTADIRSLEIIVPHNRTR